MDFYAEAEKRKQRRFSEIGELAYKRQIAAKLIEDNQRLVEEFDIAISEREAAISEIDQSQRDFNTYLAVKEGALTLDDIKAGIEAGGAEDVEIEGATEGAET